MRVCHVGWSLDGGWSAPLPPLDGERTAVLVFASPELAGARALVDVLQAYPRSSVLGCSTAGEILQGAVLQEHVAIAVCAFDHTDLCAAADLVGEGDDGLAVGLRLGERLRAARPGLVAIFTLSDGLCVNGTSLARGLSTGAGPGVVVSGGLAGDGDRFQATWVLGDGEAGPRKVAALGLYGSAIRVSVGSRGGWDTFGPERAVTRSRGQVLYELDGRPALALYKEYLGERASGLPATALLFPLAIRHDEGPPLVRTVLAVDEATQSMTFAGDIPEGATAQLMRAHLERLIDGAAQAAERAAAGLDPDAPTLALAVSCVGRRLVFGERVEDEIDACLEALPAGTSVVGFYSYGELSPRDDGPCALHNQTMTLTAWQEPP